MSCVKWKVTRIDGCNASAYNAQPVSVITWMLDIEPEVSLSRIGGMRILSSLVCTLSRMLTSTIERVYVSSECLNQPIKLRLYALDTVTVFTSIISIVVDAVRGKFFGKNNKAFASKNGVFFAGNNQR